MLHPEEPLLRRRVREPARDLIDGALPEPDGVDPRAREVADVGADLMTERGPLRRPLDHGPVDAEELLKRQEELGEDRPAELGHLRHRGQLLDEPRVPCRAEHVLERSAVRRATPADEEPAELLRLDHARRLAHPRIPGPLHRLHDLAHRAEVGGQAEHVDTRPDAGQADEVQLHDVAGEPPRLREHGHAERPVEELERALDRPGRAEVLLEPLDHRRRGHQHHVALTARGIADDAIGEQPLPESVHRARPLELLTDDPLRLVVQARGVGAHRHQPLARVGVDPLGMLERLTGGEKATPGRDLRLGLGQRARCSAFAAAGCLSPCSPIVLSRCCAFVRWTFWRTP